MIRRRRIKLKHLNYTFTIQDQIKMENWMSNLPEAATELPLSKLAIPGALI